MRRGPVVDDDPQIRIEQLLTQLEGGNRAALDELLPLVYQELSVLAHRVRGRWQGDHTLNTTALIHEMYLKLVDQQRIRADSRAHFLAIAARAMRHILINYARDRRAQKRGGAADIVPLDEMAPPTAPEGLSVARAEDLIALNDALRALEQVDRRQTRIVECRFFGGMTVDETADALGISARTVKREWAVAQAWLQRRMDTGS